jgi:hypothetical protein
MLPLTQRAEREGRFRVDDRTFWLDLFTGTTWQQFLDAGGGVSGFQESRWTTVQRIKPGDVLLCYVTGVSRFIGALEVTSAPFKDTTPIWTTNDFPCRISVKPMVMLTAQTSVPVRDVAPHLSFAADFAQPKTWTGHFRGSPTRWKGADGEAVLHALWEAEQQGVKHEVDPAQWGRNPRTFKGKTGVVTIPDRDEAVAPTRTEPQVEREATEHTEVQWLLLNLGMSMGFGVWVARNDRGRDYNGQKFADLTGMRPSLPLQFDDPTNRTVELIDVLWLRENAIVAAFEVESTTSIYSGLLRMSDLIAMQPNLNIPLYLVAPDERRSKVFDEVNRPTFSRLNPPMAQVCRYIAFAALRQKLKEVAPYVRYLKPEFLLELSQDCRLSGV